MAEAHPEYPDSDFSEEEISPINISFNKAADHVRKITSKLDNNQLLELYGLYKQGTEGSCNTPKPGWFDGKGRKKWEAWKDFEDMSSEEAKSKYITLVRKHDPDWSLDTEKTEGTTKETWVAVSTLQHSPEPELVHNELSLLEAAREDCSDRISEILAKNPQSKYEKDEDGLTALHWAADRNAVKALLVAIEGGCPVNAVDSSGQTALHYAASCGHIKSTQILLNAGASIIKDDEGNTPIDLADDHEIMNILENAP